MRAIRRNSYEARLDFVPLIDVIFVLLTFFIYSVVMMVRAEVLPVRLTQLTAGSAAQHSVINAVTIDRNGKMYFNRQPIDDKALREKFEELAKDPAKPRLYLALEDQGTTDRAPMLLHLVGEAQAAGLTDFALVGPPSTSNEKPRSATKPAATR